MEIYETWPVINDPDNGPHTPPVMGNWTWWRDGPHPQGRWLAIDWSVDNVSAQRDNRLTHPVWQDKALGPPSDFGNIMCHACGYLSDGYPEAGHHTACDGICHRDRCDYHVPVVVREEG